MKKILIATGIYPPESGGPATYSRLLEEHLPAHGFAVQVLPFREVRHLPKVLRHAAYFFKCLRFSRGVDIIYALDTVSVGLPAALCALVAHKAFVVRVPGDYAWEQARQRFGVTDELEAFQKKSYRLPVGVLRAVQKFVVRRAAAVVVPSAYMRSIVSQWGVQPQVVYSSINFPVPYELPKDRPGGFLAVTIARPVPWKGLEGLTRVAAKEKEWSLKIVDGLPYPQAMGWVKAADVFVLNSTYEGLSHALVEAMSLGVPVVATAVGGNPELITDGVDGLLIPPGDDAALHAALKRVQNDPEEARARTEAARTKTRQFSIDTAVSKLAALLNTI